MNKSVTHSGLKIYILVYQIVRCLYTLPYVRDIMVHSTWELAVHSAEINPSEVTWNARASVIDEPAGFQLLKLPENGAAKAGALVFLRSRISWLLYDMDVQIFFYILQ